MIGPAIYEILSEDSEVQLIMEGRWTPGIIPQDQPVPCGYFGTDRIKLVPVRNPMGCFNGMLEVGFQVDEDSYDVLEALTNATRRVLENFNGTVGDVNLSIGSGQTTPDDFDPELRYHTRAIEYPISGQFINHS